MRKYCIDKNLLRTEYNSLKKPFWDACRIGFERMFSPQVQNLNRFVPHNYQDDNVQNMNTEILNPNGLNDLDWTWYVTERSRYDKNYEKFYQFTPFFFEAEMYKWFSSKNNQKKILLIHGNTGIGKSTFVRYFFSEYIRMKDRELAGNTYALRISMPSIGYNVGRSEEDFDHYLYKFLIDTFKKGKYDLQDPANLIKMALLSFDRPDERTVNYFTNENPPPLTYPQQLKWIREDVVGRSRDSRSTDFADFNSLAVNYLCNIDNDIRIVIFLDNVDQLPPSIQASAWLMADYKLNWFSKWNNVFFVITIRSYLLERTTKEATLNAYIDQIQELSLLPPSLYDVLKKRKANFFDPLFPKREKDIADQNTPSCYLDTDNGRMPIYCPNEMLDSLIDAFKDRENDKCISLICNFDIRQGLEIAKALFQFPFYDWESMAGVIYNQYVKGASEANLLISYEKILDAALRKSNHLCEDSEHFFDNVYEVDSTDHFSNSLCKIFILKIIEKEGSISKNRVLEILQRLGHKEHLIKLAISRLLKCNIITSLQGTNIKDNEEACLSSNDTTLCEQYLYNISCTLYYLQAMAYCTPISSDLVKEIPLPSDIKNDSRLFTDRMKAAQVLLKQIEDDLYEQQRYINSLEGSQRLECGDYFTKYEFYNIARNIKLKIRRDIHNIFKTSIFKNIDKQDIIDMFI